MTVPEIGLDGFPKSSCANKKFTEEGFIFYTNYNSEKARLLRRILKYVFLFFGIVWSVRYYKRDSPKDIRSYLGNFGFKTRVVRSHSFNQSGLFLLVLILRKI
jgi:hypothetical protein